MAAFHSNTSSRGAHGLPGALSSITARFGARVASTTLALATAIACSQPACAALGGSPMATPDGASVNTLSAAAAQGAAASQVLRQAEPGIAASAASSPSTTPAYTVRQTTLASGTVVREYVSQAGTVFGVGWSGPQPPDLSALLGSYFPQYVAGVKASHAAGTVRGPGVVEQSGLVVHAGGHMGAFSGQAWLPQNLPAGVSAADIQ